MNFVWFKWNPLVQFANGLNQHTRDVPPQRPLFKDSNHFTIIFPPATPPSPARA
jgi:hypothetical protein